VLPICSAVVNIEHRVQKGNGLGLMGSWNRGQPPSAHSKCLSVPLRWAEMKEATNWGRLTSFFRDAFDRNTLDRSVIGALSICQRVKTILPMHRIVRIELGTTGNSC
jgi:hypothetical protein